jgi:predicted cupin superfamily sugar epimerase
VTPRAAELTRLLSLEPHPEGGSYRETWRAPSSPGVRSASTAIYFLLNRGEQSRWHRVDADEIWLHLEGAPLELLVWREGDGVERQTLGPVDAAGARPLAVVSKGVWQAARPLGDFALTSCTVAPGFDFGGFTLLAAQPALADRLRGRVPGLAGLI